MCSGEVSFYVVLGCSFTLYPLGSLDSGGNTFTEDVVLKNGHLNRYFIHPPRTATWAGASVCSCVHMYHGWMDVGVHKSCNLILHIRRMSVCMW